MPKIVTDPKVPLRRKEIYLNDAELNFFEADAKKNGFTTTKAYLEHLCRLFKAAKQHRAAEANSVTLKGIINE